MATNDRQRSEEEQKVLDKEVSKRVADELRRKEAEASAAKLSDEQKAICTVIAQQTAREVLKSLQSAAASGDDDTSNGGSGGAKEPEYGFLSEAQEHRAWRIKEEKRTGKKVERRPTFARLGE